MVIYSNPCKMRLMVLPHRMNTSLSHAYSMLGVATKERNIPYLDNICFLGGGEDGANMGDFIRERVCSQSISWLCQLSRVFYKFWYQNIVAMKNSLIRNHRKS